MEQVLTPLGPLRSEILQSIWLTYVNLKTKRSKTSIIECIVVFPLHLLFALGGRLCISKSSPLLDTRFHLPSSLRRVGISIMNFCRLFVNTLWGIPFISIFSGCREGLPPAKRQIPSSYCSKRLGVWTTSCSVDMAGLALAAALWKCFILSWRKLTRLGIFVPRLLWLVSSSHPVSRTFPIMLVIRPPPGTAKPPGCLEPRPCDEHLRRRFGP